MGNTYSQIYVHVVFAVEGRQSLIAPERKAEIFNYMISVIQDQQQKVMSINGRPDHVHLLIGLSPDKVLSDLVRDVKSASARLINEKRWLRGHFKWQRGYGAFSCSKSDVPRVARYIDNQERHHMVHSFRDEYLTLLESAGVEYDPAYVFKFIED